VVHHSRKADLLQIKSVAMLVTYVSGVVDSGIQFLVSRLLFVVNRLVCGCCSPHRLQFLLVCNA
jgi:hypothetical protein